MKTADAAKGKWRGILLALGIDESYLTGKHGPCPMCGGVDRFRWDNKGGNGSFICGGCGAGDGFKLLMEVNRWDFPTAAREVDQVVGNVKPETVRPGMTDKQNRNLSSALWRSGKPLEPGDMAHGYLSGRTQLPPQLPDLRFTPSCRAPDGNYYPALLAAIRDVEGNGVSVHRTFLGRHGKADIEEPRALMPGTLPDGAAVRLFRLHGDRLGIAEGIETAFAAAARFKMPVWSALNTAMLKKWIAPPNVKEIFVFGDCDAKFGGQAAAYELAHRLAVKSRLEVQVHIPEAKGMDWADRGVM